MSPAFANDFKELVRSRTDLVALIGESVTLSARGGGRDFAGLCPFHDDRNPSFHVYPDRQSWRCWVCEQGGDCFSWVMKRDGVDFRQALETLAERAGLEMPRGGGRGGDGGRSSRKELLDVLAWAEREFHRYFREARGAAAAREYMASRGFTEETLAAYRIGFHPLQWDWLLEAARRRFSEKLLFQARLVRPRRDGSGYRDDFVGRVLFPIRDLQGRTVAFGGRVLPGGDDAGAPKYLNSAESAVFNKSSTLYGLDLAREAIRKSGTAVVVEGYTDCMMCRQRGLANGVAPLGTALTDRHVSLLRRFAPKAVLVFDGDQAGRDAAQRALVRLLAQEIDLRILTLPEGMDPPEYLERHGAEAFAAQLNAAPEAWDFKLNAGIERFGLGTVDARQRVLDEMLAVMAQAPHLAGSVREDILLDRLSRRVGVPERTVRARLAELRRSGSERVKTAGAAIAQAPSALTELIGGRTGPDDKLEWELLEILFAAPQSAGWLRGQLGTDEFLNESLRALLQSCYDLHEHGQPPSCETVTASLEDAELKRLAVAIGHRSSEKGLMQKLREDGAHGRDPPRPALMEELVRRVRWRKERQLHEETRARAGALASNTGGLDAEQRAILRRATDHNRKRAAAGRSAEFDM